MEKNEKNCWIYENEMILSFHPVVGYLLKECPIRFNGLPVSDERCGQFG